jgi:hypothetical protein
MLLLPAAVACLSQQTGAAALLQGLLLLLLPHLLQHPPHPQHPQLPIHQQHLLLLLLLLLWQRQQLVPSFPFHLALCSCRRLKTQHLNEQGVHRCVRHPQLVW